MPRFFFHYRDGAHHKPDPEGMALPDAEAAWYQAVRSAREIIDRNLAIGTLSPGQCMEIADESGLQIIAVSLDELAGVAV